MKKLFLIVFSFWFIGLSYGQKLKQKKVSNYYSTEVFKIDKETGLREGSYSKIDDYSGIGIVTGQYEHGKKIGVWRYYALNDELLTSFDYDRLNLVYMIDPMDTKAEFPVQKNGSYVLTLVDSPAFFMGMEEDLNATLLGNKSMPKSFLNAKEYLLSAASFIVQTDGCIGEIKIEKGNDPAINADFLQMLGRLPDLWVPATQKGKTVATKHLYFLVMNDGSGKDPEVIIVKKPYVKILSIGR